MRGALWADPLWVETYTGHHEAARAAVRGLAGHGVQGIQRLRPLLALEPISRPADAADRPWIVAGTLVPVRDRKVRA